MLTAALAAALGIRIRFQMLSSDSGTFEALKALWGLKQRTNRPLIVWLGAGVSSWIGYKRWKELAEDFHRAYVKQMSSYDRVSGSKLLERDQLPEVFQLCRDCDEQYYFRLLAGSFPPVKSSPLFDRVIRDLKSISPTRIVTTNIDEALERRLPESVIERSDVPRVLHALDSGSSFIAKLHGTVSSVRSTVMSSSDYIELTHDRQYIETLKHLLGRCSVIFLGYGVRDQYLVDVLRESQDVNSLFGDGPHFLAPSEERTDLPRSVKIIRYSNEYHHDHRSSLLAVEVISREFDETLPVLEITAEPYEPRSLHVVSDLYPVGTSTTSQVVEVKGPDSERSQLLSGPAWASNEIGGQSTAAFDLAVGLTCFERTMVPLHYIGALIGTLGGVENLVRLMDQGAIQFVQWNYHDCIHTTMDGGFGNVVFAELPMQSPEEIIRSKVRFPAGSESALAAFIGKAEEQVTRVEFDKYRIQNACAGVLISPIIRKLIGLSDGTPVGNIPRWLAGPVLRIAQLLRIGSTCQSMDAASMKLMPGTARIAAIAFGAAAQGAMAAQSASYILGRNTNPIDGSFFAQNPSVWQAISKFRELETAARLRKEVLRLINYDLGAEIPAAIDAGLRQALPVSVTSSEASRDMAALLTSHGVRIPPLVWSSANMLERGPAIWRQHSLSRLKVYLKDQRLGDYDPCPCGSGDKVRFCCLDSLGS